MYKILVISDTHRKTGNAMEVIEKITDINHIIHLGDHVADAKEIENLYDIPIDYVRGNCDFHSTNVPYHKVLEIKEKKIYITHGHLEQVKFGMNTIIEMAKKNTYDVVLYGHTHVKNIFYEQNCLIMNPGSLTEPRNNNPKTYGILEIDEKNILHGTISVYEN